MLESGRSAFADDRSRPMTASGSHTVVFAGHEFPAAAELLAAALAGATVAVVEREVPEDARRGADPADGAGGRPR